MGQRRWLRPAPAQQGHVLASAAIARVMIGPVAVLGLIGIAAAGNYMHRHSAVYAPPLGRRSADPMSPARGRSHEPQPVRLQETEPFSGSVGEGSLRTTYC
jgi:hypothetical protein